MSGNTYGVVPSYFLMIGAWRNFSLEEELRVVICRPDDILRTWLMQLMASINADFHAPLYL